MVALLVDPRAGWMVASRVDLTVVLKASTRVALTAEHWVAWKVDTKGMCWADLSAEPLEYSWGKRLAKT